MDSIEANIQKIIVDKGLLQKHVAELAASIASVLTLADFHNFGLAPEFENCSLGVLP